MADENKKDSKLSVFQKAVIGMFISSGAVYEFLLKSPEVQKSLGVGFPWFLMALCIFGLSCAAMSGSQLFSFLEFIKRFFDKTKNE